MKPITIAIHGGAGTISRKKMDATRESTYRSSLQKALDAGFLILQKGGHALDAVECAVMVLEDDPLFNAGKGSVYTHEGRHEMDAAIMRGDTREAGAVTGVQLIQNPVHLARAVMEKSPHVLLGFEGAESFAREMGLPFQPAEYFDDPFRLEQWKRAVERNTIEMDHNDDKKFGTVGAVALDASGTLAAATSTGGMTNKRWGRIGDSPVIGAGTYANNSTCAVSCTGDGEFFLRAVVAYDISCLIEYKGLSLAEACDVVIKRKMVELGGEGGVIALAPSGDHCLCFNSSGMYRGFRNAHSSKVSIWED